MFRFFALRSKKRQVLQVFVAWTYKCIARAPIEQVGKIEVVDVVPCDDVRIATPEELGPALQQLGLSLTGNDFAAHDLPARIQRKYVPDERIWVTLSA